GGYVAFKALGAKAGALLGGLLGGLISSTATTVTFARRARENPAVTGAALGVVMLGSSVGYVRLMVGISVAEPRCLKTAAGPLGVLLALSLALAGAAWVRSRGRTERLPDPENPTELKSALFFAGLYALVRLAVAWGKDQLGAGGVYAVAGVS